MIFLHFSDIHYNSVYDSPFMRRLTDRTGIDLTSQLRLGLQHMRENCPAPAFILLSGDLVHEGLAKEYRELRDIIEAAFPAVPLFAAPGNHDSGEYSEGWQADASASCYYAAHLPGGLRLLSLDSRGGGYGSGRIDAEQLNWLRERIDEAPEVPSILMLHHTPHISGEIDFLTWQMENARELGDALRGGNILGCFTGHTHMRYASEFNSIPCYTVCSIGYEINSLEDRFILSNQTGYNLCEYENGVLDVRRVDIPPEGGEIFVEIPYSEL